MLLAFLGQQIVLGYGIFLLIGFLISYGGGQLGASIGYVNGITGLEAAPERALGERRARPGQVGDYRSGLLLFALAFFIASIAATRRLAAFEGRLGGTLTGWPWTPPAA